MKNILYKGYHSKKALNAFISSMNQGNLILFLPPTMDNYDFVKDLPEADYEIMGELWQGDENLPKAQGQYDISFCSGVFSSGTTKNSKLILYSKENIRSSVSSIYGLFTEEQSKRIFCYPQPYHTFGLTLGFGAHYFLNKEIYFAEGHYNQNFHETWAQNNFELTLGTPTHFYDLLNWLDTKSIDLKTRESCIIGGAKVKKNLWFDIREKLKIQNPSIGYGASEASPGISHLNPGIEPLQDGEIGSPLDHVEYKITNDGLLFSGPNLCAGILEDGKMHLPSDYLLPDLIEEQSSNSNGWVYKARLNWILNRGGEKFSLEKIETSLFNEFSLESIACCIPDERLGEELGLLIKNSNENIDKVYSYLEQEYGRKFKDNYLFVEEFPRNNNLKIDRKTASQWLIKNQKRHQ